MLKLVFTVVQLNKWWRHVLRSIIKTKQVLVVEWSWFSSNYNVRSLQARVM